MLIEEEFGVRTGHPETVAVVERHIRTLEGPRRAGRRAASGAHA
jgi:hypothetical protein